MQILCFFWSRLSFRIDLPKMSVTLHTDVGDVKLELHCDQCPKSCENFLALCASGYYDNTVIHRNIKKFMVQMGDPSGKGRGGECIWGGKFDDEFVDTLKVNAMYGNMLDLLR